MNEDPSWWKEFVLQKTQAEDAVKLGTIQSLWSGYGEIARIQLQPQHLGTLVIKHISPEAATAHPRGWDSDISVKRKLRSYAVEDNFYTQYANACGSSCRVANCFGTTSNQRERLLLLEDLDSAGYARRHTSANLQQAHSCLRWLANFHATFLNST